MDSKKIDRIWSISLMLIGIAIFILAGANMVGTELPDIIVKGLGMIDLVSLPVLAFSTVKKAKS